MKKIIICISSLLLSTSAFAQGETEVGVLFGMKNAEFDTDTSGVDFKSETGLMGGVIAYGEMGGMKFRTGGYYSARNTKSSGTKLKLAYLDVPVTLMYSFNEMFSVFGGALLGLKLSDSCSSDTAGVCDELGDNINGLHAAATVGLNARFHPNWSGEIFYEHGLNPVVDKNLATDDVDASAISAAAVFIY